MYDSLNSDSPHQVDSLSQKKVVSHSQVCTMAISRQIANITAWQMYATNTGATYDDYVAMITDYVLSRCECVNKDALTASLADPTGYVLVVHSSHKPHSSSHRQEYRDEVMLKLVLGDYSVVTTDIQIDPRDKYSILRELGVELSVESRNTDSSYIDWGRADHIFERLKRGEIRLAQAIRMVRRATCRPQLGLTTFKYRMRELGLKKSKLNGAAEFVVPRLMMEELGANSDTKRAETMPLDSATTFTEWTIGELAYYHDMSIVSIVGRVNGLDLTDSQRRWFNYINYYGEREVEYRVDDMAEFKRELIEFGGKFVGEKYSLAKSTVSDWKRKNVGRA